MRYLLQSPVSQVYLEPMISGNSHILECQRTWRRIGNRPDEVGEEAQSNTSAANVRGEDLGHPDEGRAVDALKHDDVDVYNQHAGGEAGFVVGAEVLPL